MLECKKDNYTKSIEDKIKFRNKFNTGKGGGELIFGLNLHWFVKLTVH